MAAALNTMVPILFPRPLCQGGFQELLKQWNMIEGEMGRSVLVAAFCPKHHEASRLVKPPRP